MLMLIEPEIGSRISKYETSTRGLPGASHRQLTELSSSLSIGMQPP